MTRRQWEALLPLVSLFFFALGALSALGFVLWVGLSTAELARAAKEKVWLALLPLALLLLTGWQINRWVQGYRFTAQRLAEEVGLIGGANAAHRVPVKGPQGMPELSEAINDLAARFEQLLAAQQALIEQANAELAAERNRLVALMADLSEGVIVCNEAGQILLYNPPAHQVLAGSNEQALVGLGRSIFTLLDESALRYGLERLEERRKRAQEASSLTFVSTSANGRLLRLRLALVIEREQRINGFILAMEDITEPAQHEQRREDLLQTLTEGIRPPLANIRAAIEMIEDYPTMPAARLRAFQGIISDEVQSLSSRFTEAIREVSDKQPLAGVWQREAIPAEDLLRVIQRRLYEKEITTTLQLPNEEVPIWVKLDSHALVQAIKGSIGDLISLGMEKKLVLRLISQERFAAVDLCWALTSDATEIVENWWRGRQANALEAIITQHGGELWHQVDKTANGKNNTAGKDNGLPSPPSPLSQLWERGDLTGDSPPLPKLGEGAGGEGRFRGVRLVPFGDKTAPKWLFIRLLLPMTEAPTSNLLPKIAANRGSTNGRVTYYDFDLLFHSPTQKELEERLLTDITYTVFDTETTGLNPSQGDEIVSISAVRIVNGRLLEEYFDQLVDPRRSIPRISTEIHGITEDMVRGQPTIGEVLPRFDAFAEETVLVGHNVAFDMRMLEVKAPSTGILFTNPVLDTLLLSAVLHPQQETHELEAIAQRFGLTVTNRHTSLGDTLLTAQLFLKFIPLLAERGITTLQEARDAAQQTYYATLEY